MSGAAPLSRLALRTRWALRRLLTEGRAAMVAAVPEPMSPLRLLGLDFPGPVGLAAGFDRHGSLLGVAAALGFGAVEVGTCFAGVPSRISPGPRQAGSAVRGVSLGKRPGVPWVDAAEVFLRARAEQGRGADYLCLNPGRDCPSAAGFAAIIACLAAAEGGRRPILVKLAGTHPDPLAAASAWCAAGAAGILLSAEGDGAPLATLRSLRGGLGAGTCLVSVGGIDSPEAALARRQAGADCVQVHRAVVHRGSALVSAINRAWLRG